MSYELINRGDWLEAVPSEQRRAGSPTAAAALIGVQGRPAYPSVAPTSLLAAFSRSEIVFACIDIKARAMTDPRLMVQQRSKESDWQEDIGHPLRRVLMRPNSRMDESQFWRCYIASKDLVGKFYAQKLFNNAGGVIGLNPLNPAQVVRRYEGDTHVGWTWKSGKQVMEFGLDDLLADEPDDWANPAPLAVALGSVDADAAQTDYIRAFFNNAGVPSGILTTDQELTQPQSDAIKARWRAQYGRAAGRQHEIAVLGKGSSYAKVGANLDELDSESVRGTTESRICMAFGVPPLIVYAYIGLTRATYSNLKEAWASFWDATLSPMLKSARAWLLWSLLPNFESEELIYAERVRLEWDLSRVAALQEDVDKAQGRARENFKAGALTLNELRAAIGQQPDAAGDYYLRTLALQPVPAGAELLDLDPASDAAKARYPAAVKALKAASVARIEQRLRKEATAYFAGQYEAAAAAIENEG